jgi:predicted deacetylase
VAIHDVEPATFERCARLREWLDSRGIERATLLVIPAADRHPFYNRAPHLAEWLAARVHAGDAIAQHGFRHRQLRPAGPPRQALARWQGAGAAEFVGLDRQETLAAVTAGRRLLRLGGIEPAGFVAPGYAYTRALRRTLAVTFDWWADMRGVWTADGRRSAAAPAVMLGGSNVAKRVLSPWVVRTGGALAGPLLRLDIHPADLDRDGHIEAADWVLRRASERVSVTYDELAAA